jgi:hypothetical protein
MKNRWYKYLLTLFLLFAVVAAGVLGTVMQVSAKSNSKDDVQSTAVPGQIAPRLQNLGNHQYRNALDHAYAKAMRDLHHRYPDDPDAATLYAEAFMDLRPWNYWTRDLKPYPETDVVMGVLESVNALL